MEKATNSNSEVDGMKSEVIPHKHPLILLFLLTLTAVLKGNLNGNYVGANEHFNTPFTPTGGNESAFGPVRKTSECCSHLELRVAGGGQAWKQRSPNEGRPPESLRAELPRTRKRRKTFHKVLKRG